MHQVRAHALAPSACRPKKLPRSVVPCRASGAFSGVRAQVHVCLKRKQVHTCTYLPPRTIDPLTLHKCVMTAGIYTSTPPFFPPRLSLSELRRTRLRWSATRTRRP